MIYFIIWYFYSLTKHPFYISDSTKKEKSYSYFSKDEISYVSFLQPPSDWCNESSSNNKNKDKGIILQKILIYTVKTWVWLIFNKIESVDSRHVEFTFKEPINQFKQ